METKHTLLLKQGGEAPQDWSLIKNGAIDNLFQSRVLELLKIIVRAEMETKYTLILEHIGEATQDQSSMQFWEYLRNLKVVTRVW